MSRADAQTVVIADYDYGDVSIERAIIEGAGLELVAAHCKTEDEVIDVARDADAIIAQYVTVGAKAIGALTRCRVIAHDPYRPDPDIAAQGATPVSFGELLEQADYLVIQAPLTKQAHHLIGEAELRRMKPTAFLVNTARGPIVSDDALYRGLREGWIAGAALDDIEEEPAKQRDWKPANPLFSLPNAILTPHAAYYSEESIHTVRDFAAHEVVRVLTGQPPASPVNADQLAGAYWIVQFAAAACGSLLARGFFGPEGNLAATMPKPGQSWQAAGFEAILTFGLVLMILNMAIGPKLNGPFVPLAVGAYILAWGTMGGPYEGASMNPARSFGPDLAIGNLSTWWVYLIGPVAGAVIAVGVAHVLRGPAKAEEAGAAVGTPLDRSA